MNLTRRTFCQSLAALPWFARTSLPSPTRAPRSLILIWLDGGASHLDTFDGKPEAAPEIRGDLRAVAAGRAGAFLSEHLPRLRERIGECTVIRSLTHGEGNHDRGSHFLLTGKRPSPVLVHPSLGAVRADESGALPSYVAIPHAPDYGREGFLPATRAPFELRGDPSRGGFAVEHLAPRAGAERALALAREVDALDAGARSPSERARDRFAEQAAAIAGDPELRSLFSLQREPQAVRERYGFHQLGQSCLLARRLAAGGVRTAMVTDLGWDHHVQIKTALTYGFPPKLEALDQAVAALLDDLRDQQLQDRVTVCVASEFGRTPRLNPSGGRDHWSRAQSVLLFGAGIARGAVIGRTDDRGEEPIADPVSPADLFATLAQALELDLAQILRTPDGRPVRLIDEGAKPIAGALRP